MRIVSGLMMVLCWHIELAIPMQLVAFTSAFVVSGQEHFVNHYYLVMYDNDHDHERAIF